MGHQEQECIGSPVKVQCSRLWVGGFND